ncbi:hypothetical protein DFQ27_002187 [Actinomortierella ambigua]|uniref:Uncharacterized protein n=1 Tax=Actinomortierella ambigua TaxID=1343610 RepID=A0A9P6QN50_9FUNG|nr:hypothetical protein DFQ27_002187 [Actinomortierella ambigua]
MMQTRQVTLMIGMRLICQVCYYKRPSKAEEYAKHFTNDRHFSTLTTDHHLCQYVYECARCPNKPNFGNLQSCSEHVKLHHHHSPPMSTSSSFYPFPEHYLPLSPVLSLGNSSLNDNGAFRPDITLDVKALDFGSITADEQSKKLLAITNHATLSCALEKVVLIHIEGPRPVFSIDYVPKATVFPCGSLHVILQFNPAGRRGRYRQLAVFVFRNSSVQSIIAVLMGNAI